MAARSIDESALALMADGEDVDAIFCGQEAIQRDVTRVPFRDDEFAQVVRGWASDQWVALQYRGGIDDLFTHRAGEVRCFLFEEFEYPFEVGQCAFGEMHFWHGNQRVVRLVGRALSLVSVRTIDFGRFAGLPAVRASMYACTSSIA